MFRCNYMVLNENQRNKGDCPHYVRQHNGAGSKWYFEDQSKGDFDE